MRRTLKLEKDFKVQKLSFWERDSFLIYYRVVSKYLHIIVPACVFLFGLVCKVQWLWKLASFDARAKIAVKGWNWKSDFGNPKSVHTYFIPFINSEVISSNSTTKFSLMWIPTYFFLVSQIKIVDC